MVCAFARAWRRLGVFVLVLASGAPALAQQVPLGEVARREAERRKAQPSSTKVYTNRDLPESARKPAAAQGGDPAPPVDPVAAALADPPPVERDRTPEQKGEAFWRQRMAQAREDLRRNEVLLEALQSRINALTRDFTSRDNAVQRREIGEQRTAALEELSRLAKDVERGKQQIGAIEEEARKAGVPPGWLR